MARVKISEYAAKKLLAGEAYGGVSIASDTDLDNLTLSAELYAVKVDNGTKKRNKKGLVVVGLSAKAALSQAQSFLDEGYVRVLLEPMIEHTKEDEQYFSLALVREGVSLIYNEKGGNNIEDNSLGSHQELISRKDFLSDNIPAFSFMSAAVLEQIITFQKEHHVSFIEINPFILNKDEELVCVDLAVEIDSSKLHKLPKWVESHVQQSREKSTAEINVQTLDAESTSTFSLTVFDKDASVFTLLSGGGASLVVLDEMVDSGVQAAVANYGEYSGAPSTEETCRYTKELLNLLFASKAPKKVLLIAGGVANFTDVTTTFQGVIEACSEFLDEFKKQPVLVRVRRGGPRQKEGLTSLEEFFKRNNIEAVVSGPNVTLSEAVADVTKYLK